MSSKPTYVQRVFQACSAACDLLVRLAIASIIALFAGNQCVLADEASDRTSSRVLRGGTNDAETMHRSVKVLIPPAVPPARPTPPPAPVYTTPLQSGASGAQNPLLRPGIQMDNRFPGRFPVPPSVPARNPMFGISPMQVQPIRPNVRLVPPKPVGPVWRSEIDVTVEPVPFRSAQLSMLDVQANRTASSSNQSGLRAVEMTLPNSAPQAVSTWEEWYKRVAQAIYDRWSQNTAGPGDALVSINVSCTHYVDCRVVQFTPATGAARNVDAESQFKTTALNSISTLSGDPLWAFPTCASKNLKQIVFDMELKHAVGETAGCNIVHMHDAEKLE